MGGSSQPGGCARLALSTLLGRLNRTAPPPRPLSHSVHRPTRRPAPVSRLHAQLLQPARLAVGRTRPRMHPTKKAKRPCQATAACAHAWGWPSQKRRQLHARSAAPGDASPIGWIQIHTPTACARAQPNSTRLQDGACLAGSPRPNLPEGAAGKARACIHAWRAAKRCNARGRARVWASEQLRPPQLSPDTCHAGACPQCGVVR
jgi:hypothetical protein